jgi:hypothetical protein
MSAVEGTDESSTWKQKIKKVTQKYPPSPQKPDDFLEFHPIPRDEYCLVRNGFIATRTLLHYRKPLRMACCQPCQLIYNAIEVVKPSWRDENLEKKSINLRRETISSWTVFKVQLLEGGDSWNITLAHPISMLNSTNLK